MPNMIYFLAFCILTSSSAFAQNMDVVVLEDGSGSFKQFIEQANQFKLDIADNLDTGDWIAFMRFGLEAKMDSIPPTVVDSSNQPWLVEQIKGIKRSSWYDDTLYSPALSLAAQMLDERSDKVVKCIILITDSEGSDIRSKNPDVARLVDLDIHNLPARFSQYIIILNEYSKTNGKVSSSITLTNAPAQLGLDKQGLSNLGIKDILAVMRSQIREHEETEKPNILNDEKSGRGKIVMLTVAFFAVCAIIAYFFWKKRGRKAVVETHIEIPKPVIPPLYVSFILQNDQEEDQFLGTVGLKPNQQMRLEPGFLRKPELPAGCTTFTLERASNPDRLLVSSLMDAIGVTGVDGEKTELAPGMKARIFLGTIVDVGNGYKVVIDQGHADDNLIQI